MNQAVSSFKPRVRVWGLGREALEHIQADAAPEEGWGGLNSQFILYKYINVYVTLQLK